MYNMVHACLRQIALLTCSPKLSCIKLPPDWRLELAAGQAACVVGVQYVDCYGVQVLVLTRLRPSAVDGVQRLLVGGGVAPKGRRAQAPLAAAAAALHSPSVGCCNRTPNAGASMQRRCTACSGYAVLCSPATAQAAALHRASLRHGGRRCARATGLHEQAARPCQHCARDTASVETRCSTRNLVTHLFRSSDLRIRRLHEARLEGRSFDKVITSE